MMFCSFLLFVLFCFFLNSFLLSFSVCLNCYLWPFIVGKMRKNEQENELSGSSSDLLKMINRLRGLVMQEACVGWMVRMAKSTERERERSGFFFFSFSF